MESPFPNRWRYDRPSSMEQFMEEFPDDYACAEYLANMRWPKKKFSCPQCGGTEAWRLETRPWLFECKGKVDRREGEPRCRRQTSVIAGTVMQGTHLPLRKWFLAAYLMATHSNGISALQLQSKLGIGSYKTAWLLMHKLRRTMVAPARLPLSGEVEVEETFLTYRKKSDPVGNKRSGGRNLVGQLALVGAVEVVDKRFSGRLRLQRIKDTGKATLQGFIHKNTEPGSTIKTDAWGGYEGLTGRDHVVVNLSAKNALPAHILLPQIHRVFSNFKRWMMGTYHGLRERHADSYCNEFVFRWNRRRSFQSAMKKMLGVSIKIAPITYRGIVGDTWAWRKEHQQIVLKRTKAWKVEKARALAHQTGCDLLDALDQVQQSIHRHKYQRRPSVRRAVFPQRRPGDEHYTRRYIHPPGLVPVIAGTPPLCHVPFTAKLLLPRSRAVEKSVA